jgi:hypothetical protein
MFQIFEKVTLEAIDAGAEVIGIRTDVRGGRFNHAA